MAIESGDIASRGVNIGKAYDIISELNNTLDHKVGGEISRNLEQLYMFVTEKLTQANITGEKKCLEDAHKIITTLHQGWVEAIEKLKREGHKF